MFRRHSAHKGRCLGVLLLLVVSCCIGANAVGVNYGTVGNNLPTPAQAVQLIQTTYISEVKIYSTDPALISAFANSGIALVVGTTNDEIAPLAASESFAQWWVTKKVASHYPATNIICIVVGNEVLTTAPNSTYDLLPAMQNLNTGLMNLGLGDKIKVTTPHSFGVLGTSYPPSDGVFRTDLAGPVFSPMLDFLAKTGAPFMINAYPYFAYRDNPRVALGYAMFEANSAAVVDSSTGLTYNNLFDAQVDAAYAAMAKLGHQDITVTVSETGWPSSGDADELGVGVTNAQIYMSNLLQHINTNAGTPNRPGVPIDTYIFGLFNENQKPGPSSERNFGLFQPDQQVVYNVGLVTQITNGSSPPPPPMVSTVPTPPPPSADSPPPPSATSTPPPSSNFTSPPPSTAPPPPYPVPHVPPTGGSTPSPPPPLFTTPPPAAASPPPPSNSSHPPPAEASPPPANSSHPPPVAASPPPANSSYPPPVAASPPPANSSHPPPVAASPPPATTSHPPPVSASPPPAPASPPPAVTPPPPPSFFSPPPGSNSTSPPPAQTPPFFASPPPPPTTTSPPASPPPTTASPPPTTASPPPTTASPPPASPTPVPPSPKGGVPPGVPPAPPGTPSGPNTWCVAKPGAPANDLSTALNYACGEGGADCTQIQSGASCFNPNTLFSHASLAFSSYYAKNGRNYWNCFFGNSSLITITNPSYTGCTYP